MQDAGCRMQDAGCKRLKLVKEAKMDGKISKMVSLVLRALALAMGVAVVVLHILGAAEVGTMVLLLGIGLLALAVVSLQE
jgi:hypothetical protein